MRGSAQSRFPTQAPRGYVGFAQDLLFAFFAAAAWRDMKQSYVRAKGNPHDGYDGHSSAALQRGNTNVDDDGGGDDDDGTREPVFGRAEVKARLEEVLGFARWPS